MRFSWTGLMLAPLLVPLMFSAVFVSTSSPVLSFLILMISSCIISYGTTMFLFLPAVFLLSLWRPLTALNVCLLGLVLGAAVVGLPSSWQKQIRSNRSSVQAIYGFVQWLRSIPYASGQWGAW
jgi:hypothetical protein